MTDGEPNDSCYRHLREVLWAQVATLEAAGLVRGQAQVRPDGRPRVGRAARNGLELVIR